MSLENKNVLIIDDIYDSIEHCHDELTEKKANVFISRTIDNALDIINKKNIDFVVIDLFLPRGYDKVRQYKQDIVATNNNQGELLGHHLDRCDQNIRYLYFTSQIAFYQGKKDLCFSKAPKNINTVIQKIEDLLGCEAKPTRG